MPPKRDITDTHLRRGARALQFKGKNLPLSIAEVLIHTNRPGESTLLLLEGERRDDAITRLRSWAYPLEKPTMNEALHTPGPWTIEAVSDAVRVIARVRLDGPGPRGPREVKVILARLSPPQLSETETHANAKIMAAGLDLLEALKNARKVLNICLQETIGTPSEKDFARDVAICDVAVFKAQGYLDPL